MKNKIIVTLMLLTGAPFAMADDYTPKKIANSLASSGEGYLGHFFHVLSVLTTINTIQNIGITKELICLPGDKNPYRMDVNDILNAFNTVNDPSRVFNNSKATNLIDPDSFDNTDQGGVIYIYSALVAKYPCRPLDATIAQTQYTLGGNGPAGGIVFNVDSTGTHGLEAQRSDYSKGEGIGWSDAIRVASYYGRTTGWRLPTKVELNWLYQQKDMVGGFANDYYWSSTESDSNEAWLQYFGTGLQNANTCIKSFDSCIPILSTDLQHHYDKDNAFKVRAVRPF